MERNLCNCTALRKASRRLSQLYDAALAPTGLRSTQYAILSEIRRHDDETPTLRELASALVMDASTLGQNLRPLERAHLVAIEPGAADRRRRSVKLTPRGQEIFGRAQPLWASAQTRFEQSFGVQEAADLRSQLLKIARDDLPPPLTLA